jgi:hypothetical protein
LPFEGKMRAACILENRILIVNSAGKLFINDRSSHWPYNLLDRIKTYYRALRSS